MGFFYFERFMWMLFALAVLWLIFRSPRRGRKKLDRHEQRAQEEELAAAENHNRELKAQIEQLEDRIRVLERIVTDDPQELRRQFRDLGS